MAKEKTMADIYNEMTPIQQLCVAFYVDKAISTLEKKISENSNSKSK